MSNNSLFAFLAGAAVGAATAWFLSSEKTAGTREKIRDLAHEKVDPIKDKIIAGLDAAESSLENI